MLNSTLKKGSIVYVQSEKQNIPGVQSGSRPYLIVSNDKFNTFSACVNALALTSKVNKKSPVHVFLDKRNIPELPRNSIIECEQIHTISKNSIKGTISILPSFLMKKVEEKLLFQLAISDV